MYQLIINTSTGQHHQAAAGTGDETLEILREHLARHLPAGPVNWAITSPWGAQHLGRINLNGNTSDIDDYLARVLCGEYSIRESLAREFYQQHQQPKATRWGPLQGRQNCGQDRGPDHVAAAADVERDSEASCNTGCVPTPSTPA